MNASFFDNKALKGQGGVACLDIGAKVIFNVNACSETVFKGNTAGGISNSIHISDLTDVIFSIEEGANLAGKSIENKSMFSTVDGEINTVEVESFKNDGKIEMEVWRGGDNDSIKTKDVEIEENSVLKIVANSRKFDKRR
jgi:hypothetical protein